LLADAIQLKVRRQGAVRSAMALIVAGISENGKREILGFKIALRERADSRKELLQEFKDRGLKRVEVATSDAYKGIETAFLLALPGKYRRRLRTTNMVEHPIQEVRRREKVIRIFLNHASARRLGGPVLAEKHEEWWTGQRYLKMDEYYDWCSHHTETPRAEAKPASTNHIFQPF